MPASATSRSLGEIAAIIRSKNAGPYRITFDILFNDQESYELVRRSGAITRENLAKVYGIAPEKISSVFDIPFARAMKFTILRPIAQCSSGESDVYGAQQHVPLMGIPIPV